MGKKKDKTNQQHKSAETNEECVPVKKVKRKSTPAEVEVLPKKSKQDPAASKESTVVIAAGTTIDQALLVNPALKLNKKTKRAKQREKHAKNQEDKQQKSKGREKQEVQQYLQTWSEDREKWKFQKLKQFYIQEHVFDEDKLDGEAWPMALEYLSGTRGAGKEALVKRAEAVIKEIDKQAKDSHDESLQQGSKYQRARDLLQNLG